MRYLLLLLALALPNCDSGGSEETDDPGNNNGGPCSLPCGLYVTLGDMDQIYAAELPVDAEFCLDTACVTVRVSNATFVFVDDPLGIAGAKSQADNGSIGFTLNVTESHASMGVPTPATLEVRNGASDVLYQESASVTLSDAWAGQDCSSVCLEGGVTFAPQ